MRVTLRAPMRVAAALLATLLVAGCALITPRAPQRTWEPKAEGPPPADAPQPNQPDSGDNQPSPGQAQPGSPGDTNVVATGLRLPWGLVVLPDGSALVGERTTGRILRVQPRHNAPVDVAMRIGGLDASGDGGLLDLALSPAYQQDGLIYAYLTTPTDNRVVRFSLGGHPTPMLTGIPRGRVDNGGRLAFDENGLLYVGTGDTGQPALAADPRSLAGKVLRITTFGRPAAGNPDPTSPVYSRGFRDVTGLCLDENAGAMIVTEPGAQADEIDLLRAGADFGWPRVTGAAGRPGLTDPAGTLPAAIGGAAGCAVIQRGLFVAALRGARLWAVALDARARPSRTVPLLTKVYGRLRTVVAAPDGALWLTTSNRDGAGKPVPLDDRVIRIVPPAGSTNSPT